MSKEPRYFPTADHYRCRKNPSEYLTATEARIMGDESCKPDCETELLWGVYHAIAKVAQTGLCTTLDPFRHWRGTITPHIEQTVFEHLRERGYRCGKFLWWKWVKW